MGKSVATPPTIDYAKQAQAQGEANIDSARTSAKLSNPNIYGPLGSQTVTYGTPSFDQTAYDKAMADFQANQSRSADRPDIGKFTTQRTNDEGNVVGQDIDQQGYQNALMDWLNTSGKAPTREQYTTTADQDVPTIRQTLTPEAQATLDAQQRVQKALAGLGEQGIGTAQSVLGQAFNPNLPGIQTSLGNYGQVAQTPDLSQYGQAGGGPQAGQLAETPNLSSYGQANAGVNAQGVNYGPQAGQYGMARGGPQGGQYGYAGGGPQAGMYGLAGSVDANAYGQAGGVNAGDYGQAAGINANAYGQAGGGPRAGQYGLAQNALNTSNVAAMPVNAGTTGQQAILSRLTPQIERSQEATRQRLANQGLVPGTQAYQTAMLEENQRGNDLYAQAALQGLNLDMSANAQGYGQALSSGQFGNQAVAQNFGQGQSAQQMRNAAVAQNFGQGTTAQQLTNQAIGQNFGQGVTAQQLGNQAIAQNFGQGMNAQQLQNQAIGQNFGQGVTQQQLQNAAIGQNFGQGQTANAARNAAVAQNFGQGLSAQQAQNQAAQQQYNQLMGVAGLQNQTVLQNQQAALAQQQADMARQQQLFGQGVTSTQLGNQAISQNQQAALAQQQAQNAAQLQQYNQALGGAQFGNTAQQQDLTQKLALRNQPLNEITGLMSGSQIQMPQFQGYQGQSIAPAPIFAGAQAAGQNAMNQYGIAQSGANAQTSGLFGLAGLGALAFSDRRLKSNIVKVGDHPLGIGVYEYDIFGERQRGVMADEVEKVMPSAVIGHPSGYKMVNYGKLL